MSYEDFDDYLRIYKSYSPGMKVEPKIFINREYRSILHKDGSINQISQAAQLPGVVQVVGLPDMHTGYDFPIGCAVAIDLENEHSVVSPSGVGHDINCGVRAVSTNLDYATFLKKQEDIACKLFEEIPTGLGNKGERLSHKDLNLVLEKGVLGLKELGLVQDDTEYIESAGRLPGNSRLVSQKSKGKGLNQLGSIGSGNHYLEVQRVAKIYDKETAESFKIYKEDQIVYMIHTGSRGLGYEMCLEYPRTINIHTRMGNEYLEALGCAANYAWANRAVIGRKSEEIITKAFSKAKFDLIYDVSHNIAKKEWLCVDGRSSEYLVLRKGASRAFSYDLPQAYGNQQPVPVGGSMGTFSYILAGQEESIRKTVGSCCHGAGRLHPRRETHKLWTEEDVLAQMEGIKVKYGSSRGLVEEAPDAYKDVSRVVEHCEKIGISKRVCKLEPVVVIKG